MPVDVEAFFSCLRKRHVSSVLKEQKKKTVMYYIARTDGTFFTRVIPVICFIKRVLLDQL